MMFCLIVISLKDIVKEIKSKQLNLNLTKYNYHQITLNIRYSKIVNPKR